MQAVQGRHEGHCLAGLSWHNPPMEPEPTLPPLNLLGRPLTASLLPQPHISVAPPAKPGAMENPDVCFSGRQSWLCYSASARIIGSIRSGRGIRGHRPAKKAQWGSERQSLPLFFLIFQGTNSSQKIRDAGSVTGEEGAGQGSGSF